MRLYFELFLISVGLREHGVEKGYWASLSSSQQDRLRRAALAADCQLTVSP